jgi:hypothetical protein
MEVHIDKVVTEGTLKINGEEARVLVVALEIAQDYLKAEIKHMGGMPLADKFLDDVDKMLRMSNLITDWDWSGDGDFWNTVNIEQYGVR